MQTPSDTNLEIALRQIELLRRKSPKERLMIAARLSSDVIRASKQAIARTYPNFDRGQIDTAFVELHYGHELSGGCARAQRSNMMHEQSELMLALRPVVAFLIENDVRYFVGGSVASSHHGAARSTLDVNLTVQIAETIVPKLINALSDEYYLSEPAIRSAIRRQSCFNLLHLDSSFKVDVFVTGTSPFHNSTQQRAIIVDLGSAPPLNVRVASVEDILLIKLDWYRLGNEISERQWTDLTTVARLNEQQLDIEYLQRWAKQKELEDLLERLLEETQNP